MVDRAHSRGVLQPHDGMSTKIGYGRHKKCRRATRKSALRSVSRSQVRTAMRNAMPLLFN